MAISNPANDFPGSPDCCGLDKGERQIVPCYAGGDNLIVNTYSILQSDNPML